MHLQLFRPALSGPHWDVIVDVDAEAGEIIVVIHRRVPHHFFENLQKDVERAVEQAISDLASEGAMVRELRIPLLEYGLGAISPSSYPGPRPTMTGRCSRGAFRTTHPTCVPSDRRDAGGGRRG